MRPFPAQYIENYAFYGSFGLGRLLRPPKKSKFQLCFKVFFSKVVFFHKNLALGTQKCQKMHFKPQNRDKTSFLGHFRQTRPRIIVSCDWYNNTTGLQKGLKKGGARGYFPAKSAILYHFLAKSAFFNHFPAKSAFFDDFPAFLEFLEQWCSHAK